MRKEVFFSLVLVFGLSTYALTASSADVSVLIERAKKGEADAQGYAKAQYNLGFRYDKGQGVPKDDTEAAKRWRKAAEQGNARAQYNLGFMYSKGLGVPQDYILAHMWFNLTASRYSASEGEKRKKAVKNRIRVASKMTPDQIAEAQRLAREWKPKKEVK